MSRDLSYETDVEGRTDPGFRIGKLCLKCGNGGEEIHAGEDGQTGSPAG